MILLNFLAAVLSITASVMQIILFLKELKIKANKTLHAAPKGRGGNPKYKDIYFIQIPTSG